MKCFDSIKIYFGLFKILCLKISSSFQSRNFLTRFYGKSFQKDRSVRYRTSKNERSTCLVSVPIEPSVNARQESTEHQ